MGHVAAPRAVRFEHRTDDDPVLGIGTATPRLSWVVPAADASFVQEAYEVELSRAGGEAEVVRVVGGEQVLVPWPAAPLTSRESVRVRVRVHGAGMASDWSHPATVEAGLLGTGDWTARFISPRELGTLGAPAPVLRSAFDLPGGVVRARLYVTAHGLYQASLNGVASATRSWPRDGPATVTGCGTRPMTSPAWSARAATTWRCCSATAGTGDGWAGTAVMPTTATGWPCSPSWR